MDTKTATFTFTFTFFTLLFLYTVSAARPCTVYPPVINPTDVKTSSKSTASSKILLPGGKVITNETTGINHDPQPEKTTKNDVTTPHTNFSRFHPINRHFQGRPHRGPRPTATHHRPCHMPPPMEVSHRKDDVTVERTDKTRSKTFHGEVPTNWLKVKHHYGSHRQHNNNNNNINISNNRNNHRDKNGENVMKTKNVFDREKMTNLKRQQKLKKSHGKTGLMKNIRKFLKHTFD